MVVVVGAWGAASFENDTASDWFFVVEEAPDPGAVMAAAIDDALSEAGYLEADVCCEAIAAAELCAACAGQLPPRLPDHVLAWVQAHAHSPQADEISQAVQAVARVRAESELRELWDEASDDPHNEWLALVDDLLARLDRSQAGSPPSLSP
jgi:hypothetical protein